MLIRGILLLFVMMAVLIHAPMAGAVDARPYVQALQSENFAQLVGDLTNLENSKAKDTDGMYVFHRTVNSFAYDLSLDPEVSLKLLNQWCEQKPSYLSHLVRGVFYSDFAWADRGNKYADKVLTEAWPVFQERLLLSKADLLKAAELNPASAEPWIALIVTYRGLSLPEEVAASFEKAIAIDKNHFNAYHMMMIAKMEKWFGSNEEMFEFARKSYEEHKSDPVFGFLVIQANDELAKRIALQSNTKRSDYYKIPVNYTAVKALIDEILSVYPQSVKAWTWSATIEYFVGNYAAAYKASQSMGDNVDEDIWGKKASYMQTKAWLERQHDKGVF